MSTKTVKVEINIPLYDYDCLAQISEASGWPLEEVIVRTIRHGLPPSLAKVPAEFHDALLALNKMDDKQLLQVVEGQIRAPEMNLAQKKADFTTLWRTYALSLLRWRGHPVPKAYEAIIGQ
ncbi:MAG: hypothetical protein Kow0080_25490 [Candidatus Promineifilaceae bacterium]